MIYHYSTETLEKLVEFRRSLQPTPNKGLLTLLLDGQARYDGKLMDKVLFGDRDMGINQKDRICLVKEEVSRHFAWSYYQVDGMGEVTEERVEWGACGVDFSKEKVHRCFRMLVVKDFEDLEERLSTDVVERRTEIIRRKILLCSKMAPTLEANKEPSSGLQERRKPGKGSAKKRKKHSVKITDGVKPENSTLLSFAILKDKKDSVPRLGHRFRNVSSLCIYRARDTVRKASDIVNPVRVTYIKFFERVRPAFYGVVKEKLFTKNTLRRISYVVDYEYDSDIEWEDCEDAEDVNTTSESEHTWSEEECNFVDTESENSNDREHHAPSYSFPCANVVFFHDYTPDLKAPLLAHDEVPDSLLADLASGIRKCEDFGSFCASFARTYNIKLKSVQRRARKLLKDIVGVDLRLPT